MTCYRDSFTFTFISQKRKSLHECESWSLAVREEHSLRVFESRGKENIWTYEGGSDRRMERIA
jgi:hypothetical protein